jgi:hypothetical protein
MILFGAKDAVSAVASIDTARERFQLQRYLDSMENSPINEEVVSSR